MPQLWPAPCCVEAAAEKESIGVAPIERHSVEQQLQSSMTAFEAKLLDCLTQQHDTMARRLESILAGFLERSAVATFAPGGELAHPISPGAHPSTFPMGNGLMVSPFKSEASSPSRMQEAQKISNVSNAVQLEINDLKSQNVINGVILEDKANDPTSPVSKAESKKNELQAHRSLMQSVGWKIASMEEGAVKSMGGQSVQDTEGFKIRYEYQKALSHFVHSNAFAVVASGVVLANSIMIGYCLDQDIGRALQGQDPLGWEKTSDLTFTVLFTTELVFRFAAELDYFWTGKGRMWNAFDALVVVTGLVEAAELVAVSFTYLRVLRVIKVVKVFRVIRVLRFFRELRMMALSILSCMGSVGWAFILLFIVIYVMAMVLLEAARDYLRVPEGGEEPDVEVIDCLTTWFDGVWMSLFTLIQAVSGGNSWGDLARPFAKIGWFYGLAFTLFVTFVMFGLLNVLIGVFVQSTSAIADLDRDFVIQEEMNRNQSVMNKMKDLFVSVDTDGSGTVTWPELNSKLDDPVVQGYFSLVQIDIQEAEGLFHLLDVDESGEVGVEEFIMGCMRLKGAAKSIDMATMLYENKRLHVTLKKFMVEVKAEISMLDRAMKFRIG